MTRTSTSISFILLFLISCQEKTVFELRPSPASVYHFATETEESESRNGDSMAPTIREFDFSLQMRKEDSHLKTFNMVVDYIGITRPEMKMVQGVNGSMMVQSTGRTITMSTDTLTTGATVADPYWYAVAPFLVHDSLKIILNEYGAVDNCWGYETIKNKILGITRQDPRNLSPAIRDYIGPDAISDLMKNLFFYLPGKVIQPGDQWVKNYELTLKAPVKYSHNITVDAIEDDMVHLSVQTIVSARQGRGRIIAEGELTGKVMASLSTGMPVNMELIENSVTHTDHYDVKKKRIFRASVHQSPAK